MTRIPTLAEKARAAGESRVCPDCGSALLKDDGANRNFECGRWDKAPTGGISKHRGVIAVYRRCATYIAETTRRTR
ncbi:MAG TPA: hypothetical protein VFH61_04195 [Thermoleophilia bacterium]|nr:hypothetical protein [Thermoleophilia bacterium]